MSKEVNYTLGVLRLALGLIFLWAFFDKLFGLGFNTARDKSWLLGNSPTSGFLSNLNGWFSSVFNALSGSVLVDWLFMLGLLLIGLALVLGIVVNLASYSGVLLLFLMWLASLPLEHHLFLDEHIIYLIVLLLITFTNAGDYLGFGKEWKKLVKKNKWLN